MVFIRPNDIHNYDFFNNYDFELITTGFFSDALELSCQLLECPVSFFTDPALSPHVVLEGHVFSDIQQKLLKISKKEAGNQRKQYFRSILPQILYLFFKNSDADSLLPPLPNWLSVLTEQMNHPHHFSVGLPRLLELSGVSQEYLTRSFRKYLDLTPTKFINMKRINYAAYLLLNENYKILDVCYECGFQSLSHFYHIFKEQFGCTPSSFIKTYKD